jgi:23S rRNA pseudouridine1911/1915/1917 synthase
VTPLEFVVPAEFDGHRLDRFLVSVLPEHSRSQIQRLIADGHVVIKGQGGDGARGQKDAKPNLAVREGLHITVDVPDAVATATAREDLPLEIRLQDADVAVIN